MALSCLSHFPVAFCVFVRALRAQHFCLLYFP